MGFAETEKCKPLGAAGNSEDEEEMLTPHDVLSTFLAGAHHNETSTFNDLADMLIYELRRYGYEIVEKPKPDRSPMTASQRAMKARIESLMTENGGYTREDLAALGVSWPPKKGWKNALIKGAK
jgi:hypothetical protein